MKTNYIFILIVSLLISCAQEQTSFKKIKLHEPDDNEINLYSDSTAIKYANIGRDYMEEMQLDSAKLYLLKSIQIEKHPDTYNNLGIIEYNSKNYNAAIKYHNLGIQSDSISWINYINIARVYMVNEEYEEANIILTEVTNSNNEYWSAYAFFYKSICAIKNDIDCELATNYLEKAKILKTFKDGIQLQYERTTKEIKNACE